MEQVRSRDAGYATYRKRQYHTKVVVHHHTEQCSLSHRS
jgi:hypothetical protein